MLELVRRAGHSCSPHQFRETIVCDCEFYVGNGAEPIYPHCMVAVEVHSGKWHRYKRADLLRMTAPPFDTGPKSVFTGYAVAAEMSCFQALGWKRPDNLLDLFAEHRAETNGIVKPGKHRKNNLLTACAMRGVSTIDHERKHAMQEMAGTRKTLSDGEMAELIDYCGTDVDETARLFGKMAPTLDWPAALCRGRYGWSTAAIQGIGVPIDNPLWQRLQENWTAVRELLVAALNREGFYDGDEFRKGRVVEWLDRKGIPYPRHPSGEAKLNGDTLKDLARIDPALWRLRWLRGLMGKMRRLALTVSDEGVNKFGLLPYNTVTGRNSPSNSASIFGPSKWLRHLIMAPPGHVLIYFDWSSQEYVIAAALSGDEHMLEDCQRGNDPYIRFGQRAGILPEGATKTSHRDMRGVLKVSALATLYGQGAKGLAVQLGIPVPHAEQLLRDHARLYPDLYAWQRDYLLGASLCGMAWTPQRWPMAVHHKTKITTLKNFPCQALGAEMMRAAAVRAIDEGVEVCCPVHDAFLVRAPLDQVERVTEQMRTIMEEVALKLCGVPISVDAKVLQPGARYVELEAAEMWNLVLACLARVEARVA